MNQKILIMWRCISAKSLAAVAQEFNVKLMSTTDKDTIWYLEICQAKKNIQSRVNKIHSQKPRKQQILSKKNY